MRRRVKKSRRESGRAGGPTCLPTFLTFALVVLAGCGTLVVLAGCGGGSSGASTNTISLSTPGSTAANADAVALISSTPITKASYEHWLAVEKAMGVSSNVGHRTLGFLITSQWVLAEAAARGISVSDTEVKQRLAQVERQSFPKAGALQKYMASSGETEADLLGRVKVELLEARIAEKVTAGKSATQHKAVLASFQSAFTHHWKSYTTCKTGYVMEDCVEYKGKPENLPTTNSSSSNSSTRASTGSSARASTGSSVRSAASNASGELPLPPAGALAISSPAFGLNEQIPAAYTCDGANTSPPLRWQNVPAKAAALVLFVIDDSESGPATGIRWVVGDINPKSHGVAAGQAPEGGIVGADTQGHTGYGGICPQHGTTSTIEFELYALSKRIPLTTGFQPAIAEQEYGGARLALGEAASTYALYHRP
jgi:phosphatidylethanolamine-binding protein (PEBP) family uncharacterized protein